MNLRLLRASALAAVVVLLQACASTPPPEVFDGPTATIDDSASGGSRNSAGKFFFVAEVRGKPVRGALDASRRASYGSGFSMRIVSSSRRVLAGPAQLKLTARNAYAAPIQEMLLSGRLITVAGTIDVDLKPGATYRVNGVLDAFRSEVWLEDASTGLVIGEKIVQLPKPELIALSASGGSYTCCNLHYDDNWIGDGNFAALPLVPVGSRVWINGWGKERVNVTVEGRVMEIGLDYANKTESREQYAQKILVKTDPKLRIAGYSPAVQAAIRAGRVSIGMTREQVITSLGYPRSDLNKTIDASTWTYMADDDLFYTVTFGADGLLASVGGKPEATRLAIDAP